LLKLSSKTKPVGTAFAYVLSNTFVMKKRAVIYFSKNKALKILESPLSADLKTLLSATFALSHSRVVKNHIQNTLMQLEKPTYKLTA
jgi:hypothetical protein